MVALKYTNVKVLIFETATLVLLLERNKIFTATLVCTSEACELFCTIRGRTSLARVFRCLHASVCGEKNVPKGESGGPGPQ